MKKILITGKNSYVGNNLEAWLNQYPDKYVIKRISVRDNQWKSMEFSNFDVIVHVAGIVHQKETKENKELYYKVNRDLTIELARKSKQEGVAQFIFLSTMSVYGIESGIINNETPLNPKTHYGISKLEAEKELENIKDDTFKIVVLRPPMIYGRDCPGNYQRLRKLALLLPVFPNLKNKRSMIYIDNLSMFIEELIVTLSEGLYLPQNKEYVSTDYLVKLICENNNKNIRTVNLFNKLIDNINLTTFKKVFGNLFYENGDIMDEFYDFKTTIIFSEK